MKARLTIGEAAKLAGVTTKAVRHYHKVGLLAEPERSEAGYRLYGADELLRLRRIRQLKAFGFSLGRIENVLGAQGNEASLREIFSGLHAEVSSEIEALEERRWMLERLLAEENLEDAAEPSGEPYAIELAETHLGEHLSGISAEVWEQERKLWAKMDSFEWPEGYKELQETVTRYYADHLEELREMLPLGERLAALASKPEDAPEVERLAEDLARHLGRTPFPDNPLKGSPLASGSIGNVFAEVLQTNYSPAQRRAIELTEKFLEETDRR